MKMRRMGREVVFFWWVLFRSIGDGRGRWVRICILLVLVFMRF